MGGSSGLAIIPAAARRFCFGVLAVLLSPCNSGVGAVTFAYSGFNWNSLHLVSKSSWIFNSSTRCFKYYDADSALYYSPTSGRLLYPFPVQMITPGSTIVKSWSSTFVYRLHRPSTQFGLGPGMAFVMVPDNVTLGASEDFMGIITEETLGAGKNNESDNHTLGVELDIFSNVEFNDPNDNHIGVNLGSMTSTYSVEPVYSLASSSAILYQQIWIDYSEADLRMDIYYANYSEGKPAQPQVIQSGLDLSLLKDYMHIGFSSSNKLGSTDVPYVCAWSFSNDGTPAPSIVIGQDAPPAAPPPPPAEPSTIAEKGGKKKNWAGVYAGVPAAFVLVVLLLFTIILRRWLRFLRHPLRFFISHAGGPDGAEKNFAVSLHDRMTGYTWSISSLNVRFFIDEEDIADGEYFSERIFAELAQSDVLLVVVTDAFFRGKWPMTELITFMETHANNPWRRLQVVPLFYKLTPENTRDHLRDEIWERAWEEMSTANHPLDVEKCRQAVKWLCGWKGPLYRSERRDYDKEYIEKICESVNQILRKERNFGAYLWRTMKCFRVPR